MKEGKGNMQTFLTEVFKRKKTLSPEDVKKEGFNSLEEFRKAWIEIYGSWDAGQIITVYEFKLVEKRYRMSA